MRMRAVFGEAFLDGFTMAGVGKLRSPANPDALFAPEEEDDKGSELIAFAVEEEETGRVQVRGNLHQLPVTALDSILRAVTAERNRRVSEEPIAGVSKG